MRGRRCPLPAFERPKLNSRPEFQAPFSGAADLEDKIKAAHWSAVEWAKTKRGGATIQSADVLPDNVHFRGTPAGNARCTLSQARV
jgi:hypothetical protein